MGWPIWNQSKCSQVCLETIQQKICKKKMTDRKEYQREYMRIKRAKQREAQAGAAGKVASTSPVRPVKASTVCEDFNAKQLEQVRIIIRGELEALLTANTVSKLTPKLTTANTVDRACPYCGEPVTGPTQKIYCSSRCRKLGQISPSNDDLRRFGEFWAEYPKGYKVNPKDARIAWVRGKCDLIADEILSTLRNEKLHQSVWPLPGTYLNSKPWKCKS